jgi:hypothetical protein
MSQSEATPYTMMTGLGVNGTAGVKANAISAAPWPEILGGEGGPVAISQGSNPTWYVNNQAGVSIHACTQSAACTPTAFGVSAVVDDADVGGDGLTMTVPAPFVVDDLDPGRLLIGTCRVWRGLADGSSWVAGNAISPIFGGNTANSSCNGNPLIRSLASMALPGGNELVYVGMSGEADGGATLGGHVLAATISASSQGQPVWQDLTFNPVSNDQLGMNIRGMGISSIFIDSHDATGNTVYVTVEGIPSLSQEPQTLYGTTDGGAHWMLMSANLPSTQANSLVVDPQDPATVYVATDVGVYFTPQIANCASTRPMCWTAYGTGLPEAPVIQLSAAPLSGSEHVLTASTYGRGVWKIPLRTASQALTSATMTPASLIFAIQIYGTLSKPQAVVLKNTGTAALLVTGVTVSGDFSKTDTCINASLNPGANCTIQVTFAPKQAGSRTGELAVLANVPGGALKAADGPGKRIAQRDRRDSRRGAGATGPVEFSGYERGRDQQSNHGDRDQPQPCKQPHRAQPGNIGGLSTGEQYLCCYPLGLGKLYVRRGVFAHHSRCTNRVFDREQQRTNQWSIYTACGDGIRLRGFNIRLGQPDRCQRPDRQLQAVNRAVEWLRRGVHVRLRYVASKCAVQL